jgi:hypothetical protein
MRGKKSKIRVRIEHVFGPQQTSPGRRLVHTIGIVRALAKIGSQNLTTTSAACSLERLAAA